MTLDPLQPRPKKQKVVIRGHTVKCDTCGKGKFFARDVHLDATGDTITQFDPPKLKTRIFECANCGRLHWFVAD